MDEEISRVLARRLGPGVCPLADRLDAQTVQERLRIAVSLLK